MILEEVAQVSGGITVLGGFQEKCRCGPERQFSGHM